MPKFCAGLLPALFIGSVLPISGSVSATEAPYPQRAIRLIVGYVPGGAADTLARLLASYLTDDLGQSVTVENRAGATGDIAAEFVARSAPDGHTLLLASTGNTVNRTLRRSPGYDLIADFAPVGIVATTANVLVVHPGIPAKNLSEFIAYAKANPDRLSCASSGVGSTTHLSCELFNMATGTDILHVPYRGSAPAIADLLGGEVTCMFDNMPTSLPHIRSGRLRAIGLTAADRSPLAPDVPTLAEAGLPGFAVESWFGLLAPAATPAKAIARLDEALRRAFTSAELRHAYAENGYVPPSVSASPEAFAVFIAAEVDKWGEIVKAVDLVVK